MLDIRNIIWPYLNGNPKQKSPFERSSLVIDDKNLDLALNLVQKQYENEDKRLGNIESKSIVFVGTLSVITGIVIAIIKDFIDKPWYNIFFLLMIILYFSRALYFSIQVLKRKTYSVLDETEINLSLTDDKEYKRTIITKYINYASKNSFVVNRKVESMALAQAYFIRGVVITVFFAFISFILAITKNGHQINDWCWNLFSTILSINLESWVIIALLVLVVVNLIYNIINSVIIRNLAKRAKDEGHEKKEQIN